MAALCVVAVNGLLPGVWLTAGASSRRGCHCWRFPRDQCEQPCLAEAACVSAVLAALPLALGSPPPVRSPHGVGGEALLQLGPWGGKCWGAKQPPGDPAQLSTQ